jgi:hypothetical protein
MRWKESSGRSISIVATWPRPWTTWSRSGHTGEYATLLLARVSSLLYAFLPSHCPAVKSPDGIPMHTYATLSVPCSPLLQVKMQEVERLTEGGSLTMSIGDTDSKLKAMLSDALNDADSQIAYREEQLATLRDNVEALKREARDLQSQLVIVTAERNAAQVLSARPHSSAAGN